MTPADRIAALLGPGAARILIGIVGAPGAGKSTFAEQAAHDLNARGIRTVVLPMDGFHLPQARLVELGRREWMGAPDTFDVDAFVATLAAVRDARGEVLAPSFDRTIEEPVPGALRISPSIRVVIVDGNYLLHDADGWEHVAPLLDHIFALRITPELRRERLVARHVAFGKTREQAEAWVFGPDERNAELIERGLDRGSEPRLWIDVD